MGKGSAELVARGVLLVGGPGIYHAEDAMSFVVDFASELVMIDCGTGRSLRTIIEIIEGAGTDPHTISTLILCEGHFGIHRPNRRVEQYIRGYQRQYE